MSVTMRLAAVVGTMSLLAAFTVATAETTIYPVSFPMGSVALHVADFETIHGVAAMLGRDPALSVTIVGKTDTVGTPQYNEGLSERRAEAVFAALVNTYKVPANRVELRWTGENQPVVATADNKPELQNRVVEIVLH